MKKWINGLFNNTTVNGVNVVNGVSSVNGNTNEINMEENQTVEVKGIAMIDIDASFVDVTLLPSNDEEIHVRFYAKGNSNLTQEEFASLLTIKKEQDTLHIFIKSANVSIMNGKCFMTIQLPNKVYSKLSHKSSSGDITLKDMKFENGQLSTMSGDIEANQLYIASAFDLSTMSGDITLEKVSMDSLEEQSFFKNMTPNEQDVKHEIKMKTMSGDISLKLEHKAGYHAKTSSMSGDVRTIGKQSLEGVKVTANTMSGDIFIQN